jgi:hypothetical protein
MTARRSAMSQIQVTPTWKKVSFALTALVAVAVVGLWAKPTAPTPSTVGAAVPAEAAAAISPMEFMILRGRKLPPMEYVEPF